MPIGYEAANFGYHQHVQSSHKKGPPSTGTIRHGDEVDVPENEDNDLSDMLMHDPAEGLGTNEDLPDFDADEKCRSEDDDEIRLLVDADENCRHEDDDEIRPSVDADENCRPVGADENCQHKDDDEIRLLVGADENYRRVDADENCRHEDDDEIRPSVDADENCRPVDADENCRRKRKRTSERLDL